MPYIKKESRPFYNIIISKVVQGIDDGTFSDTEAYMQGIKFREYIGKTTMETQDGQFNYFLTKLFIELHWVGDSLTYYSYMKSQKNIEILVRECLELYNYTPSYFNYNRAIGMLNCCMLELKRQYGNKSIVATTFLQKIIRVYYETKIAKYEDEKISENGDL